MLYGRCSTKWARLQDVYARAENLDSKIFTGQSWTRKVTRYFWLAFQALWKVRNTDLHGTTFAESEPTRRARILPVVTNLYQHIHALAPSDRIMLCMPLAERLQQPTSVLTTWLSVVQPAFDEARIREDIDLDEEAALAEEEEIEQALAAEADYDS
jgi:hypothetical protein